MVGSADVFSGTIGPGNSPGILGAGNVTFHDPGPNDFQVELNGTLPGSDYDRLAVTGTVALGTATTLSAARGFDYALNDTLDIITATSITGTFAGLPDNTTFSIAGQMFKINYLTTAVRLTATAPVPVTLQEFSAE